MNNEKIKIVWENWLEGSISSIQAEIELVNAGCNKETIKAILIADQEINTKKNKDV